MAINVNEVNAALEAIEVSKGISRETVLEALKESMSKAFKKSLGGDDAMVEVTLDPDTGVFEMCQLKNVVEDVQDDLLEIGIDELPEKDEGKYKVGDVYRIPAEISELRKAMVITIKGLMRQKFAEAEKEILHEQFKDKINTLITGRIETFDERGASVNIGRTSVYLSRKEMIKDERFAPGDIIKLFVQDVDNGTKGAHIVVSRSCEGFLGAIMSEEIHDINDGTIQIVKIAREAGERSKVAVSSKDPNVDPAGACIGPNGNRIQKVVAQLGNASTKEKIDIIAYKEDSRLYIMEALKPAHVLGIKVDEEKKSALVVVKDDSLSLAIGRKGVNARLAVKLTGYNIDIKVESETLEQGLEYESYEELQALELEQRAQRIAEAQRETLVYQNREVSSLPGVPEGYVAPQQRVYADESSEELDKALEQVVEKEELETPKAPKAEEKKVEEAAPAKEEKPAEAPKATVKTTTTLEDLEKSLEDESSKSQKKSGAKRSKKKAEEKEEVAQVAHTEGPRMSIYTEEELKAMEEEDKEVEESYEDEDDIDYDEYDKYYDED